MSRARSSRADFADATSRVALLSSVLLVGLTFAAELSSASQVSALYVIPVALGLWMTGRGQICVATSATLLTVASSFFYRPSAPSWVAVVSPAAAIAAIWTVLLLVRRYKAAQRAASHEHSQAEHYLDVAEVMIVALDDKGCVTLINNKGCDLLGYPREQILGKPWLESFVPEDDWGRVHRVFEGVVAGKIEHFRYFENRVRTAAGEERLIAWHNKLLHDDEGRIATTLSSGTDITAARAAECSLRESEQRYRHLFETASDFILVTDVRGEVLYANRAWTETMGVGRAPSSPFHLGDMLDPPSLQRWNATCAAGSTGGETEPVELTFITDDGQRITTEGSLSVRIDGARPPLVQGILRDVTARRELERMKDEFVTVVSHELRTPLTAIRGSLGLLEAGVTAENMASTIALVRIARGNTDRLIRMVNDILDLETVAAGGAPLKLEPLTASGILEPTLQALAGIASQADVAIHRETSIADDVEFPGDRDRLAQVLTNLLDNAIKFSPRGGSVVVRSESEGKLRLRISVQDRGPGISKKDQQRLFQRFGMLDSSNARRQSGTGLGLAISKAIVDLHGGSVGVESDRGKGATFFFSLPLVDPHASHMALRS